MDFIYLEIKHFNYRNGLIRRCFFNHVFCIKIIHFDMEVKNNKMCYITFKFFIFYNKF